MEAPAAHVQEDGAEAGSAGLKPFLRKSCWESGQQLHSPGKVGLSARQGPTEEQDMEEQTFAIEEEPEAQEGFVIEKEPAPTQGFVETEEY